MRMYREAVPGSTPLRNAIVFRGQATTSPLFPLQVNLVCIAGAAALAGTVEGILWGQESDAVHRDLTLVCIAIVALALIGVLICRRITRRRVAEILAALPAGSVGQREAEEVILPDTRENRRRIAADARRLRTPLDRARAVVGWCLLAGLLGIGAAGVLRRDLPWLAVVAVVLVAAGIVALLLLHLARWVQLTRLPGVLRASPADAEQERGRALTRDLRDQMRTTMILWTLTAVVVAGAESGREMLGSGAGQMIGISPGVVALVWLSGIAILTWLRVRLERLGPALREEFGYDVPVRTASGDSSPGPV
jgi:hypothetical protein